MREILRTMGVLHTAAAVLTAGGLAWMWLAGHGVEVVGAVLAGIAVGALVAVYGDLKHAVRRYARGLFVPGGEHAWRRSSR
ncbi:hypothetical protein ACFXKC_53315 [Streptomyces sp. NPDC059340]|uniref:hypothetical protein n=1 Tax=Streptomyces sp. NPDC059340 TaxID=3346806 RepID=UPI0036B2A8BC